MNSAKFFDTNIAATRRLAISSSVARVRLTALLAVGSTSLALACGAVPTESSARGESELAAPTQAATTLTSTPPKCDAGFESVCEGDSYADGGTLCYCAPDPVVSTASTANCQGASDAYGIAANKTWGFAPAEVQAWWTKNACSTSPASSANLCQKASEIYGIAASQTWGYAPASVQAWWAANSCQTSPLEAESLCQRASDTYGISAGKTWGSAPSYVQSWWQSNACQTAPHSKTPCQLASDYYETSANKSWGYADQAVQSFWTASACGTAPSANVCQELSDRYGIAAGKSWGVAQYLDGTHPTFKDANGTVYYENVQATWQNNSCNTQPVSTANLLADNCQRASNLYTIVANVSFGSAPAPVQTWWSANGCNAQPLFSENVCQSISNTFGTGANGSFAAADAYTQSRWAAYLCNTSPVATTKDFQ